jgi:hypothetical protein
MNRDPARSARRAVHPAHPVGRVDPRRVPADAVRRVQLYTAIGSSILSTALDVSREKSGKHRRTR